MKGTKMKGLLGKEFLCECGRSHKVQTEEVLIGVGAVRELPSLIKRFTEGDSIAIIADENTWLAAGGEVAHLLKEENFQVKDLVIVPTKGRVVRCDHSTVESLLQLLEEDFRFILSVGAGTISDIGKILATKRGVNCGTVATAPSMNGYTSTISAIMENGVKKTIPVQAPRFVVCDTTILLDSPRDMISAGVGDLFSKPVSGADWLLSSIIQETYYCPYPVRIADEALKGVWKRRVPLSPTRTFIENLSHSLLLSGISMAIAGTSSPASGGEHLLSHFWDMTEEIEERPHNLHGLQVGFATLVSLSLYERFLCLKPQDLTVSRAESARPSLETVKGVFERLPEETREEVSKFIEMKFAENQDPSIFIKKVKARWDRIREEVSPFLISKEKVREVYIRAKVPIHADELNLTERELKEAVLYSLFIRDRFTIYDLLTWTGFLQDWVEDILKEFG